MAGLKVLGIDSIRPRVIVESLITLLLLGISANSLFELWKLAPTVFTGERSVPDWGSWGWFLTPVLFFLGWLFYLRHRYRYFFSSVTAVTDDSAVARHKGVVIALSRPELSPDEIIEKIEKCTSDTVETLYPIKSIGQLFKGIYHHSTDLRFVWLIQTEESRAYARCLSIFISRFMPGVKIAEVVDSSIGSMVTGKSDLELIENTKLLLNTIYSGKNLEAHRLKKSDIIVDISGGTKSITVGMIFGAIDSAIDIQYVEQRTLHYQVIPLRIDHAIILDKTSDYLAELYLEKKKRELETRK